MPFLKSAADIFEALSDLFAGLNGALGIVKIASDKEAFGSSM